MNLCKLCLRNEADKKNSHLISQFFRKKLYNEVERQPLRKVIRGEGFKYVQDLEKEDYIFCAECESRFNIIETYCSQNLFNSFHKYQIDFKFKLVTNGNNEYYICDYLSPDILNLFIISLIWRTTLSKEKMYEIPIRDEYIEYMRKDLNDNLMYRHIDYENHKKTIMNDYYAYYIFTTKKILKEQKGHILPFNLRNRRFGLHLGDYLVYLDFYPEIEKMVFPHLLNSRQSDKIKLGIIPRESWNNMLKLINNRIYEK